MSLTDDWKAEKLEEGEYFIKTNLKEEHIRVDTYTMLGIKDDKVVMGFLKYNDVVTEVLAPCDYDKMIHDEASYKALCNKWERLYSENEKLRIVLKECKEFLYMYPTSEIDSGDLYRRIVNILGDNDE